MFCIFRLLQISSFNGKMNALNEVNKVIANVSFQSSRHSQMEEDEWLTAEKMAVSYLPFRKIISVIDKVDNFNIFLIPKPFLTFCYTQGKSPFK